MLHVMTTYETFKKTGKLALQKKLEKKNIHQVPVLDKIVVAMGIGSLATRKGVKDFTDLENNLMAITGQKPQLIKSRKSISNFKLREDMPVMLMVTLRGKKAYDFVERLRTYVLPRMRDFVGLIGKKFDGRGNYSVGFPNQVIFPEIMPEAISTPMGVQITFGTTADTDADAKALMQELGIIFYQQ